MIKEAEAYWVEKDGIEYNSSRTRRFAPVIGRRFRPGRYTISERPSSTNKETIIAEKIFGMNPPHAIRRAVNRQEGGTTRG